jgi:hypothetical protein
MPATIFLRNLASRQLTAANRAIALLWFHGLRDPAVEVSVQQLCKEIEEAGFPRPNSTRLSAALKRDKRTVTGRKGSFRVSITKRPELDRKYGALVKSRPIPPSDSILPADLFDETRGYIQRVVLQINASYDAALYDCCAVMCRRLLETLIIEVYEAKGLKRRLVDGDGHYLMFGGLLAVIEKETAFSLGRNSFKGLREFKKLGDLSAHNRRFNARRTDIDKGTANIRVAAEELLHLAALI